MYKVLIVEDEMLVRVGLKNSIEWKKFDMDVIADVANGEAALKVYEQEAPDLIITDIKMPVMDGMELIAKIRQKDSKTKFIILSCLEEFEYARQAMAMSVSGYILKLTMSTQEMEDVLQKVYEELQSQKIPASLHKNRKIEIDVLKDRVIKDYLFYSLYSENEFSRMMSDMSWKVGPGGLMLCIMEIGEYWRLKDKFEDAHGQLLKFTILNVLNEILENHMNGEAFHDSENRYMLLLNFNGSSGWTEIRGKLIPIIENIQKVMKNYFDSPVYISASSRYDGFSSMKKMYGECAELLKNRYFSRDNVFLNMDHKDYTLIQTWGHRLKEAAGRWECLGREQQAELEAKLAAIAKAGAADEQYIKQMLVQLLQWSPAYLKISQDPLEAGINKINYSSNVIAAIEQVELFLEEAAKTRLNMLKVSAEVARAIEYICNNYERPVSLNEIAEYAGLSGGYLSNLFKKEMNKNLIEYLNEFRIDKAKEMLLKTNLKAYEIAEKVGFSDNGYFSRTFRRITGTRPNEFKRKLVVNRNSGADYEDT